MSFAKNCALSVSVLALAVGLGASQANAQEVRGNFNLPFEAHWGNVVLQPGEYALRISTATSAAHPVMYISQEGRTVMVLAGPSGRAESDRNYLKVDSVGRAHVIREFNSAVLGQRFTFSVPKSVSKQVAIARNETVMIPLGM
jgi:hypothetical protein